jgi:hypothetical protein
MAEEHRVLLLTVFGGVVLICIVRWSSLLTVLIGRPAARCRDGSLSFSGCH